MENLKHKLILVIGQPYAGSSTVAKYISDKYNYIFIDFNHILDELYNSFHIAYRSQDSSLMCDVALKYAQLFNDIYGIPYQISAKYIAEWWTYFEIYNNKLERIIRIDNSLNKFIRNWKRKVILLATDYEPESNIIVTGLYQDKDIAELDFNIIKIGVESTLISKIVYGLNVSEYIGNSKTYKKYAKAINQVCNNTDYKIINNLTDIAQLYIKIDDIIKEINYETTKETI